jgi:hypothetical protein
MYMLPGYRSPLICACALLIVSGCGSSSTGTSSGYINVPGGGGTGGTGGGPTGNPIGGGSGPTGSTDSVVGTPSVAGTVSVIVGVKRTISITFTSSDGRAISGFGISGSLGTLPAGWSGPATFACTSVSTGSGCVLNLTFAPVAVGSGTLTLDYVFVDNATVPNTSGSLTIAYTATPQNNIVAAASPTGQINAVVGGGSQSVIVNFTTDDGGPATALALSTDLTALPAGWGSTAKTLSCASVSTGNGCQLDLTYSPTAAGRGMLTLNYAYNDNAGMAKTGSLNVPYAATTNDNVVATASPTGQINAVVGGGSQAVSVTFTTDDGQPASALQLTSSLSALPAGWSSTATSFTCSSLGSGTGCQLPLTYAPSAAGSGTLTLSYAYQNDAGVAKTGSLNIAYRATTHDNVVGTPSPNPVAVTTGSGASAAVKVTFTTDDGNLANNLSVTSGLAGLPSDWSGTSGSFGCSNVSTGTGCQLSLTYAPTAVGSGTLSLTYAYNDDSGTVKSGSVSIPYTAMPPPHLYVAQLTQLTPPAGALYDCLLNTDGTLSTCAQTGNGFSAPTGIVFNGSTSAYVTDYGSNAVYLCNVGIDGSLSGCASQGSNFQNPLQLAINGNTLYATNANPTSGVTTCTIGVNGTLSLCTQSSGLGTAGIAANASFAYVSVDPTTVDVCAIGASGGLANCVSAGGTFSGAYGITLSGGYAYIANQGNGTVSVCSINPVGTFAACAASSIGGAPTDAVIKGSQAYVNSGIGNIYLCSVDAGGAITNCVPSNGGTSFSFGVQQIAIH